MKKTYKIPLTFNTYGKDELDAINTSLASGYYSMGECVEEFEKKFAKYVGAKHCVMVNSGSSANLLLSASLLYRYKKQAPLIRGDEVLVPALLWPTTMWPLMQLGLVPILVDVNDRTMSIDIDDAKQKLSARTRGIFLIHVLGLPANMDEVMKFSREHDLVVLEDCCESLGARFNGKHVGTFGAGGTFSFFFSHHLTTMEGGAVVTNDEGHANDLRSMRAHGWIRDRSDKDVIRQEICDNNIDERWYFILPGFNLRPTELQGAIGMVQLEKIDRFIAKRKNIARIAASIFNNSNDIKIFGTDLSPSIFDCSWMNIAILTQDNSTLGKGKLVRIFEEAGIETRPIIAGDFSQHPASQYCSNVSEYKITKRLHSQGFMISAFTDNEDLFSSLMMGIASQCQ